MPERPVVIRIRYGGLPKDLPECIACIGFFDSLHKGHQQLIRRCIEEAETLDLPPVLICFDKDPLEIITGSPQLHILSYEERIRKIHELGIDRIIVFEVDERLMNIDAKSFIADYLNRMNIRKLICGFDFHFGFQGKGDIDTLKKEGNFETIVIPQISYYKCKISSSRIKREIIRGNFRLVERLLGYRYYLDVSITNVENKDGKYLVYAECLDKYKVLPKKGTYNENLVLNIDNRFEIITDGKKHPGEILRLEF